MSLLDALNREEAHFFTELLKRQVEIFNHDFALLFNDKVKVVQPSFGHCTAQKIVTEMPPRSTHIIMKWEGECTGNVIISVTSTEVKTLRGLLMMMQVSAIEESLKSEISEEEKDAFKEIASQVNSSHDNAMHEILTIDFRSTLKSVTFHNEVAQNDMLTSVFTDEAYFVHSAVMKITDFPDGLITQYYPVAMMKKVFKLEKVGECGHSGIHKKGVKTVLIIDKDPAARKQIKGFLKDRGLNIIETDDGIKAFQLLVRMNIDLVFLDLDIPHMDGLEICKKMRNNLQRDIIPTIVCSTKISKEDVTTAATYGVRDFLVKPINDKRLFEQKVQRYLS